MAKLKNHKFTPADIHWAIRPGNYGPFERWVLKSIGWDEYVENLKQSYPKELLEKYCPKKEPVSESGV